MGVFAKISDAELLFAGLARAQEVAGDRAAFKILLGHVKAVLAESRIDVVGGALAGLVYTSIPVSSNTAMALRLLPRPTRPRS